MSFLPKFIVGAACAALLASCGGDSARVTVYCTVDQDIAEPLLAAFEKKTGVALDPVFDLEATKTTGLFYRLIAESNHVQADVFWNNEFSRSVALAQMGLFQTYSPPTASDLPAQFRDPRALWTPASARARVIVYNKNLVSEADAPKTLDDLLNPRWKGKVAVADPLFGTTATHFAALWILRGEAAAQAWWLGILENQALVVPGNAVVRDRVAQGDAWVGLTDTDDLWVGVDDGKALGWVYPDANGAGTLLIPGTVALVRGAPQPDLGKQLIDFLVSAEAESLLAALPARQMPLRPALGVRPPASSLKDVRASDFDMNAISAALEKSQAWIRSRRGFQ